MRHRGNRAPDARSRSPGLGRLLPGPSSGKLVRIPDAAAQRAYPGACWGRNGVETPRELDRP
jgi:hypothetical protein